MKSLVYLVLHYLILLSLANHLLLRNSLDYIPKLCQVKLSLLLM